MVLISSGVTCDSFYVTWALYSVHFYKLKKILLSPYLFQHLSILNMNYSLSYFLSHPSHVYVNVFRTAFENEYFLFTPSPPLSFYPSCFYVLKGQGYFSSCIDFLAFVISDFAKKKKKLMQYDSFTRINWFFLIFIRRFAGSMLSRLEKEMATNFSILTWKIPWIEEPGELQSMESQRV